jgi:hypothetical protein
VLRLRPWWILGGIGILLVFAALGLGYVQLTTGDSSGFAAEPKLPAAEAVRPVLLSIPPRSFPLLSLPERTNGISSVRLRLLVGSAILLVLAGLLFVLSLRRGPLDGGSS